MKRIVLMAVVFLLAAALVYAGDYEVSKKAGELSVLIKMDRNPPISGDNNMEVAITDAAGKAVTDAMVAIAYSMPAMAGMPAMSYKADGKLKGTVYRAKIIYSMSGSWNNEIRITRGGKTATARFTVDAK